MKVIRTTTLALAIAALPMLAACSQPASDADATDEAATSDATDADAGKSEGFISGAIQEGLDEARRELREGNITLNGDGPVVNVNGKQYGSGQADPDLPKAEITPEGDLLIAGEPVQIDAGQRAMLLDYRGGIIALAEAGIAIGGKGAGLAEAALKEAVGAIFSGNTEEMERSVEAEAKKLQAEARVLCTKLPAVLESQQRLAASLPEFKPYATMTQADVDDCVKDMEDEGTWSTQ